MRHSSCSEEIGKGKGMIARVETGTLKVNILLKIFIEV